MILISSTLLGGLRLRKALSAALIHLLISLFVGGLVALLIFLVWYPYPYQNLSGAGKLLFLVIAIDIVCGPLLTLIIFNPAKPKKELWRDMTLVVIIQLAALGYGLWTVWQARPLYLVHEIDRFKVISLPAIDESAFAVLPDELKPKLWAGPLVVGIRAPKNSQEREIVMFESTQGGRDYGERPEFYIPYTPEVAVKAFISAKPLAAFLQKHPTQQAAANKIGMDKGFNILEARYVPVIARQDWVAVVDKQGTIQGFLKGDGF